MFYSTNSRKKILKIQTKEGLSDLEVAYLFRISPGAVIRWRRGFLDGVKPLDLESLLQDVHDHADSSQEERAKRLGVTRSTVCLGLKKIKWLTTREGNLCCCIDNWLNNLPPGEKRSGELLRLRTAQAYVNESPLLDLSQLGLSSLPTGILGQLSGLCALDLSGNLLTTLAGSKIAELKRLQYLYLSNNLLTSVEELRGMFWLRRLDLENNLNLTDRTPLQKFSEKGAPENLPCLLQRVKAKRRRLPCTVVGRGPKQIRDSNNPNFTDRTPSQKFPEKRAFDPENLLRLSQGERSKRPRVSHSTTSREQKWIRDLNNPNFTVLTSLQNFFVRKASDLEKLKQEIQEHSGALERELHACMDGWMDKLPHEEQASGQLFCLRVVQACKEVSSQLDLSQLGLSTLPTEVLGQLSWLLSLDLSENFLDTLAGSGISKLKQLQHLDLSGNLLTSLAGGGLTGLRKLQILKLSSNLLTNVEELGEMYWLQTLNLANNPTLTDRTPLQNFPESKLNLSWIDVTELSSQTQPPSELRQLKIRSEDLDTPDIVESRAICRPPEITPPCNNSYGLLPGNGQGSPSNASPARGNLSAAVAGSTVGSENWRPLGSIEPAADGHVGCPIEQVFYAPFNAQG